MRVAGTSRRQIARTLSAAYAHALLSEDTFVRRTDRLLEGGIIEPARLIGDLTLRRVSPAARLVARLRRALERERRPPALLALDWTGGRSELLIGRHRGCDLIVDDAAVSRLHARVRFRDGHWIVQDLGSTNGTAVNGIPVGRCELRPGDLITIGTSRLQVD